MSKKARAAMADLIQSLARWRLWIALAWWDVRRPYHRTLLGPIWEPLGYAAVIALLAPLFGTSLSPYVASPTLYLGTGYAIWHFISGILLDGTNALARDGRILLHQTIPLSLFSLRVIARNLIVLLANLLVMLSAALAFGFPFAFDPLQAFAGVALLLWNALAWGMALSFLGVRFPDLQQFILLAVRLAFFLTPVLWHPDMFSGVSSGVWQLRSLYVDFNPFHHAIEILRAPLLGQSVEARSWALVSTVAAAGSVLAFIFLTIWRRRVVFWI